MADYAPPNDTRWIDIQKRVCLHIFCRGLLSRLLKVLFVLCFVWHCCRPTVTVRTSAPLTVGQTFTRWANNFLLERMKKIEDLQLDLSDGLILIDLLEVISSKSLGRHNKAPKLRAQKLENTGQCLNFLKNEGIKLVGIGPEGVLSLLAPSCLVPLLAYLKLTPRLQISLIRT
jgi:hypothetical protein